MKKLIVLLTLFWFVSYGFAQDNISKSELKTILDTTQLDVRDTAKMNYLIKLVSRNIKLNALDLAGLWRKKLSWPANMVIAEAIILKSKENILNVLVDAHSKYSNKQVDRMIVLTLIKFRVFYYPIDFENHYSDKNVKYEIIPNKEIFPILINLLDDESKVSEAVISHEEESIRNLTIVALEQYFTRKDKAFSSICNYSNASVKKDLKEWWVKNKSTVVWKQEERVFIANK